ncbi:MAG: TolC family protein [Desulfobulbaceae bacterium]|nr:TolC family protein [Desulfobulbaceae bacterium]HIJ89646.1 TolC family protein [Deltaproteobacteria bacterium]
MTHRTPTAEDTGRSLASPRRITFLCACILLLAGFSQAAETNDTTAPPEIWTLRNAVRFAVRNNPDSRMARNRIEAAQAAITMEKSSFYPRLDLNSRYDQTNNPMYSFGNILNQGGFNQTIDFNNPGRTDNLNLGVRLGYRFFNGGRDLAGLKAVEAQTVSSQMELGAVQAQLAFEVVRTFQLIVQTEDLIKAQESAVEAISASLAVAQARYQEGILLKADLLDLEVQQAKAREGLIQTRHSLQVSRRIFLSLMGLHDGPVILDPAQGSGQEIPQAADHAQRYELKSLEAMIRAAKARVRQAQGGYYPSLEGFAGYDVDKGYVTDGSGDSWQAGIKLQYNLSEGGRTSAEIARASSLLAEAQERKRKTELAITLEVKQAEFAVQDAKERLQVTEKSVTQAQESARINRLLFAEGKLLSSDLIGVENRLTDALVRRIVAETSQRIAIADLRRALGLPQFPETSNEPQSEKTDFPISHETGN